jgi:hypothetical protein
MKTITRVEPYEPNMLQNRTIIFHAQSLMMEHIRKRNQGKSMIKIVSLTNHTINQ